jgi:hypothetical protein
MPQTLSRSWSREKTRRGWRSRCSSSSCSFAVRLTGRLPRLTSRVSRSSLRFEEEARRPDRAAAEQRPHAGHQLLIGERLDEVVVGAAVEAPDAVRGGVAGGQHQDRDLAFGPEPAADLDPVEAGHHHIEDHEVGWSFARTREPFGPVTGGVHVVALVDERAAER